MSEVLENMVRGLALHYLHGRTVDEAVEAGRRAGLPEELLESLPGMIFQVTSAASAVHIGERELEDVVDQLVNGGAPRHDAEHLVGLELDFLGELAEDGGEDRPLPQLDKPWFEYGQPFRLP